MNSFLNRGASTSDAEGRVFFSSLTSTAWRRIVPAVLLASAMTMPMAAQAGDTSGPAVSAPNGKISIEGGSISDKGGFLGLGSYTVPLGHDFGAQFDAAFGNVNSHFLGGGAVHLFARDPSKYLFGFYGSLHTWNDINIWRAAGEAELYSNRLSLNGLAGVESVNGSSSSDGSHFFGLLGLSYYPTDNLKLSGGFDYENQTGMGTAGVEYLMHHGSTPVSLFAKGRFAADSRYRSLTAGLRVHFGANPKASLINRNRTADPDNYTPVFPVGTTTGASSGEELAACVEGTHYATTTACSCPDDGWRPHYPEDNEVVDYYTCPSGISAPG